MDRLAVFKGSMKVERPTLIGNIILLLLFAIQAGGVFAVMGPPYYAGLVLVTIQCIWWVRSQKMNDSEVCLKLFKSNHPLGLIIFVSIIAGHYLPLTGG